MNDFINLLDKNVAIDVLEASIEIDRAISDYITESSMLPLLDVFVESDNDTQAQASSGKFSQAVKKVIESIKKMINKMIEGFKDIFTREDITAEEYFKNPNVKIQMEQNLEQISAEIDEEILKGRKLVQAISKGTHIDDHKIAAFCDGAANIGNKHGKFIITAAGALIAGKKLKDNANKHSKIVSADLKLLDEVVAKKSTERRHAAQDAQRAAKYQGKPVRYAVSQGVTDIERQAGKLIGALGKLVSKSVGLGLQITGEISKARNNLS